MGSKEKIISLVNRFYGDFLMPSRLGFYERILNLAIDSGYQIITLAKFIELVNLKILGKESKYFILRHDIDTDISTAKQFFNIEKNNGIRSTYYFRLSTLDISLMKEINGFGSEASYHYEEIATYAKKNNIKDKQGIYNNISIIRQMFISNFKKIEGMLGYKLLTVAAHGDFANRYLKMPNYELLDDSIRKELGIIAEAYDPIFEQFQKARITDIPYPYFFRPYSPIEAIKLDLQIIYFLVHPRQWRVNRKDNFKFNVQRTWEGLIYGK